MATPTADATRKTSFTKVNMIRIENRQVAAIILKKEPNRWSVVSIRDIGATDHPVDKVAAFSKELLILSFNDVLPEDKKFGYVPATFEQIKSAIEFARGKEDVLVHCDGGVSRSSALGYLIACDRVGSSEAVKLLNRSRHVPNSWIVWIGANLLGDPSIIDCFNTFMENSSLIV